MSTVSSFLEDNLNMLSLSESSFITNILSLKFLNTLSGTYLFPSTSSSMSLSLSSDHDLMFLPTRFFGSRIEPLNLLSISSSVGKSTPSSSLEYLKFLLSSKRLASMMSCLLLIPPKSISIWPELDSINDCSMFFIIEAKLSSVTFFDVKSLARYISFSL